MGQFITRLSAGLSQREGNFTFDLKGKRNGESSDPFQPPGRQVVNLLKLIQKSLILILIILRMLLKNISKKRTMFREIS